MSGHSKWSKVKHQKATTDAVKSSAFTKASRAITVAVREGGNIMDPNKNFRLRLAIEQARAVNMPKHSIDRAIERAGGVGGEAIDTVTYEGYGLGGVAYLVETKTDNHQRTGALVKHEFERSGGSLASPGAVSFQFDRSADSRMKPKYAVAVSDDVHKKNEMLIRSLRSLDEVQEVYTTMA